VVRSHRSQITWAAVSAACALVAFSRLAHAQSPAAVECRTTETQAECHARLKCNSSEDLEDCKKRLLRCKAGEKLDECQKRIRDDAARRSGGGDPNQRGGGDANQRGGGNDANQTGRDREPDHQGSDRRDREPDRQGSDRRDHDRGESRRHRGDGRSGDNRGRRHRGGASKSFEANKTFGLGLELGEPTGLNGKYFLSDKAALDFGLGVIYSHYYYGDGVHLYGDFLYHPVSLVSAEAFELPLYIGGGLRFWNFNYCDMNLCDYHGSALGIRIPVGISFDFNNTPLDIFIQLTPVIDFVYGDYYDRYRDRSHIGIDLSVGIRFWFK